MSIDRYPWFSGVSQQLAQAYQQQRLAHALLLHAPAQSGKADYARAISASLLCQKNESLENACGQCKSCQLLSSDTHPDFYFIDRLMNDKGKPKKSIGIDQIRTLNAKLADTAQLGGWRVAVISSVGLMTTAAFNALLKTLEEPGRETLLILLTDSLQQVPATIRSRCQQLAPSLGHDKLSPWLQQQTNATDEQIAQAIAVCYGAPLAAQTYLQSKGSEQRQQLAALMDGVLANRLTAAELVAQANLPEDSLADQLCDYFYQCIRDKAMAAQSAQSHQVPDKLLFQIYTKLIEYKRGQNAGSNLQASLQFNAILTQWFEIGKKIRHNSNA